MFDETKPITVCEDLPGGASWNCQVRWPSDEEWLEWAAGLRFEVSGSAPRAVNSGYRSKRLLAAIRLDAEDRRFTIPQAIAVIETLLSSTMLSVEQEGDVVWLRLQVLGGVVTHHLLRIPSHAERAEFTAAAVDRKELRIRTVLSLEPAARFYDLLHLSHTGYASPLVPVVHKAVIVADLLGYLTRQSEKPEPIE